MGPLLLDADPLVVRAAVGCLHNLSCEEDAVERLVEQDVLTPLATLVSQAEPADMSADRAGQHRLRVMLDSLGLLWNLVEQSPTALQVFNQQRLAVPAIKNLGGTAVPSELILVSLSLLTAACDGNPEGQQELQQHIPVVVRLVRQEEGLLQVRLAAVMLLFNIYTTSTLPAEALKLIVITAVECLIKDSNDQLVSQFMSGKFNSENENTEEHEIDMETNDNDKVIECKRDDPWLNLCKAQITALQVLTNLATRDDDVDEDEGSYGSDEDLDEVTDGLQNHQTAAEFVTPELLGVVVSRCAELPDETRLGLVSGRAGRTALRLQEDLRLHGFLCLANLVQGCKADQLGGLTAARSTWTALCLTLCSRRTTARLTESVSSAVRSYTALLSLETGGLADSLGPAELEQFRQVYINNSDTEAVITRYMKTIVN